MTELEVWKVNLWDGGDRHNFGFYMSRSISKAEIEKKHPHCFIQAELLVIFDSLKEVDENNERKVRQRAWDKLTPSERRVLGLVERP